ncbi:hypothetical protein MASR1M90_20140 [Desulfovibrionales bacterium]
MLDAPVLPFDLTQLFAENSSRLAHMYDASAFAHDFAATMRFDQEQSALVQRSALLHDIGYAPALQIHNFHPLDGALFLEKHREHPLVIEGVLRHSMAEHKAGTLPHVRSFYADRPAHDNAQWLVRAVTIADWRAAGIGGRVSFGQRLDDIITRNPDNPRKAARATDMVSHVRQWLREALCAAFQPTELPWIFSDVDNTLVRPGDAVPERIVHAVQAYVRQGGKFSLATGKHPDSILGLIHELDLADLPHIAVNGTCLVHKSTYRLLAHLPESVRYLADRLEAMGFPVVLYRFGGIEAGRHWTDALSDLFEKYGEARPATRTQPGPLLKILCIVKDDDEQRERSLRELAKEFNTDCCRSDTQFLEFLPPEASKGIALRTVLQEAQWPLLHSIAVGDSENDAPMFAQCGMCAAVANASASTVRGADWILPACHASGVTDMLDAIRQYGWTGCRAEEQAGQAE